MRPGEASGSNGHRFVLARSHAVVRMVCGLPPEEEDERMEIPPGDRPALDMEEDAGRLEDGGAVPDLGADWEAIGPGTFD